MLIGRILINNWIIIHMKCFENWAARSLKCFNNKQIDSRFYCSYFCLCSDLHHIIEEKLFCPLSVYQWLILWRALCLVLLLVLKKDCWQNDSFFLIKTYYFIKTGMLTNEMSGSSFIVGHSPSVNTFCTTVMHPARMNSDSARRQSDCTKRYKRTHLINNQYVHNTVLIAWTPEKSLFYNFLFRHWRSTPEASAVSRLCNVWSKGAQRKYCNCKTEINVITSEKQRLSLYLL